MRNLKSSRPHFVLMIGDDGVLFVPNAVPGEGEAFYAATGDANGEAEIFSILAQHPRIPLTLFADTLAQDFRREVLPRLAFFDRPRLIQRRLQQAFPQAGITAALNLPQHQALFAGLHESNPVFAWLDKLKEKLPRRVPRIALLPVECADMAAALLSNTEWGLLLSRQRTGGFRQIVIHNGELIFTRLTPPLPPESGTHEIAQAIARDIQASLGYLSRMGLTEPSQLRTVLIVPEGVQQALRSLTLPVGAPRMLAPYEAAKQLHLPFLAAVNESYSDSLYAGWLMRKRKLRLPLMPPDAARSRQEDVVRSWGWRTATAALLIALGMIGIRASGPVGAFLEARQEMAQLAVLEQNLAEGQVAMPSGQSLGRLRQAAERRRIFEQPVSVPWTVLAGLGRGIGGDARLVRLLWQNNGEKPADEIVQADLHLSGDGLPNKQQVVSRFQAIAQNVAQVMPDYKVEITRYPFPALPREALSNSPAENHKDEVATAELTLRRAAP